MTHFISYKYRDNGKPPRQDNKTYFNGHGGNFNPKTIRVPSLKRSNSVWKRFYNLFPHLRWLDTYAGSKLKKI